MLTRYFALVIGIAFVLAGVGGFIPGINQPPPADTPHLALHTGYGYLLGLFPVNIMHNLFHLTIGVLGLLAYFCQQKARRFAQGVAVLLGLLTVLGLVPGLNTLFGLLPLFGHDIWLHGVEALAAAYCGFVPEISQSGTYLNPDTK